MPPTTESVVSILYQLLEIKRPKHIPIFFCDYLKIPKSFSLFKRKDCCENSPSGQPADHQRAGHILFFSFYFLVPSYRYCFLLFFAIILLFTFLWLTMTNHFNRDGSGRFICLNKELGFFLIGTFFSSLYRYFSITLSCDILCLSEKGKIPEDKTGRGTILGVNNTIVP